MRGLGIYKPCRPSQILRSEELEQNVIRILMEEYINPFDIGIDLEGLINVSLGVPLNDEAIEFLLSPPEIIQGKRNENNLLRSGCTKERFCSMMLSRDVNSRISPRQRN